LLIGSQVHNGAVNRVRRRAGVLMSVVALSSAVLTGCSDDPEDEPTPDPEPTATSTPGSATASETPYLPVPDGVELTAQGSELALGDSAVVAYRPRQDVVGVLGITVQRIDKTSFKESFVGWKLGPEFTGTTPYFVRAKLTNEGETDLGGRPVPLRIVDTADRLVEPSQFKGTFKPCPSKPFPETFASGDSRVVCLVFLAPEGSELEAVSFRPSQDFNPITWTGTITKPLPDKPDKPKGNKGKGGKGDQRN
jgi:hypothetical protein